ncbi:hypothetical protein JMN32_19700 [Fulvivirga sp. 29W222]|uniref:Uncharacterized protein n=1 Tax=Fulvivirga marina TaxID=2494733 RepID=A0A937G215_9BACT|nr:hypothetical protein [Fulvivirga marina]MBL6448545.1 hypothetical protein [Fulvivirga marina]
MKEKNNNLTISVDENVYDLAKDGKINSIMIETDTELSKKALERDSDEVIITCSEKRGSIKRRVVLVDHVKHSYLGKGYPAAYRTRKRMTRIMIDMLIPNLEKNEPEQVTTIK